MSTIITDQEIIDACKQEKSMAKACDLVGLKFSTFKRRAQILNVYNTNQSGKGLQKRKCSTEDILSNKVPFRPHGLKMRLIEDGIKEYKCECCGIHEWLGKSLMLELDHINGNGKDNSLSNVRILCPNCHSQTPTFRGRKN